MELLFQLEYETLMVHIEVMKPFTGSFQDLADMRRDALAVYKSWGVMHRN